MPESKSETKQPTTRKQDAPKKQPTPKATPETKPQDAKATAAPGKPETAESATNTNAPASAPQESVATTQETATPTAEQAATSPNPATIPSTIPAAIPANTPTVTVEGVGTFAVVDSGKKAEEPTPKKEQSPAESAISQSEELLTIQSGEVPAKASEAPKGIVVTQVFADRLEPPSEEDLKSLPIPGEGEGFSMRLHPAYFFQFLDHPFSVNREVKDYKDLFQSIQENGINEPIKARPRAGGGLELLSGHRRHDVAKQLNYPVPVVIVQVDDDTARIEVVDGNLHRQDIPTSELARAAKMKMEALARKAGRRSKMEQLTAPQKRTDQQVAEDMGMSRNQVQRLVRIDALVPELKQQVDDKKLPFNTAVELSYMKPEEQGRVADFMAKEQVVPSMAQATALKEASRQGQAAEKKAPGTAESHKVDEKKIASIMSPRKEPELKVILTGTELKDYFPGKAPTVSEAKRTIFEALDLRKKVLERQAKKQEIKGGSKEQSR